MTKYLNKGLLLAALVTVATQASATGFNKTEQNVTGKVMTSGQFYSTLANTKTDQVATKFGFPDQFLTMKDAKGQAEGIVWVFKNAVQKADGLKDARFVFLKGEMKYVALSGQTNATALSNTAPITASKVMTSDQFYNKFANSKTEQVATNFGFPDQILTLKDAKGQTEGVVWVYKGAVQKADGLKDARIVFLQGQKKYAVLSSVA